MTYRYVGRHISRLSVKEVHVQTRYLGFKLRYGVEFGLPLSPVVRRTLPKLNNFLQLLGTETIFKICVFQTGLYTEFH